MIEKFPFYFQNAGYLTTIYILCSLLIFHPALSSNQRSFTSRMLISGWVLALILLGILVGLTQNPSISIFWIGKILILLIIAICLKQSGELVVQAITSGIELGRPGLVSTFLFCLVCIGHIYLLWFTGFPNIDLSLYYDVGATIVSAVLFFVLCSAQSDKEAPWIAFIVSALTASLLSLDPLRLIRFPLDGLILYFPLWFIMRFPYGLLGSFVFCALHVFVHTALSITT